MIAFGHNRKLGMRYVSTNQFDGSTDRVAELVDSAKGLDSEPCLL